MTRRTIPTDHEPAQQTPAIKDRGRTSRPARAYARPRLFTIAAAGALLEVLGPAQAGYGGGGMP
jgi:hypothetical protein